MIARDYDVRDFGAVPDGIANNAPFIQRAIDECSAAGGGRVILTGGTFMSGTIALKDGVELHLEADSVLLGSPRCEDYPEMPWKHVEPAMLPRFQSAAFVRADECDRIAITGYGTIDCNGDSFIRKADPEFWMPYRRINDHTPPRVIMLAGCRNIRIAGITITNQPAGWSIWLTDCDLASVDDVKILARLDYPNNDGIHVNSSRDVRISNCTINCGDDALIVRANNAALKENKVCERVTVTNCTLTSHSSGIRVGWLNDGTIRNCSFSNLVMTGTTNGISMLLPCRGETRISDEGREATRIENLTFSDIIMSDTFGCPVDILISSNPSVHCSAIRNLYFHGIRSSSHQMPRISGRKDAVIENVSFDGCHFEVTPMADDDDPRAHGCVPFRDGLVHHPTVTYVRGLQLNGTDFSVDGAEETVFWA